MDNEMDYDTGGSGNEMDYGDAVPGMPAPQSGFDAFWSTLNTTYASNPTYAALGGTSLATTLGPVVGTVQGGTNQAGDGKTESSSLSKWFGALSSDDKKMGLTVATLLAGGLANIGKGKREQQAADALTLNATSNAARVAEEARQFDTKMANGSAIGQTNFGTAMQPLGMINAPVTLTRNRLRPTPGVPA